MINSILITGCNRGIGLGLVKTLTKLPKPPDHIFATCREIERAVELKELANQHKNIHLIEIDLLNFNSYDKLVQEISSVVQDSGLNVLINNAGIAPKSTRINLTNEKDLLHTFTTNTIAPILLTKFCLPLLEKASKKNESLPMGIERAAIINMSSSLGSIQSNVEGGLYAYRASKAALNAATKSLSIDLMRHKILCANMHPGWVRTDMGGSKAPLDVQTSCKGILDTIMKFNKSHNGGFYQYDGDNLPW